MDDELKQVRIAALELALRQMINCCRCGSTCDNPKWCAGCYNARQLLGLIPSPNEKRIQKARKELADGDFHVL